MATDLALATHSASAPRGALTTSAAAAASVAVALAAWGVVADVVGDVDNPLVLMFLLGGNLPGPWALAAFVVGAVAARSGARPLIAAFWAAASLVLADGLYYAGQVVVGTRSSADAVVSAAVTWGVVAVAAGGALGVAGAVWARPDRHGGDAGAVGIGVVAAVLLAEAASIMPRDLDLGQLGRTAYALVDALVAVMLVRLVARGAWPRFVQTVVVLGAVGALAAAWVLQMINGAIR